ncbi:MarR family transcriptional regulator [Amycolatopsis antarctica]|uniref:MarR family transcriptional regulator n=1 Tax=Amycolatopsis antarctica TaxID=1854586 RepID=A0A263D0J4_9PSEU|nr:MarR family transcriptional regulator [Amycolatopsis antarctica]OZM71739.1 MarR family transcriptional regulator [Amycolatopsis antarctica]
MDTGWDLEFADDAGRCFARQYGLPPMTGRVIGWLLVCDPAAQTIAQIAESLQASRTGVTAAARQLEDWSWLRRSRTAGERVDRVRLHPEVWSRLLDNQSEYAALGVLARRGLATAGGESRVRLAELAAFAEFLAEKMPGLVAEWQTRLDAVHAGHRR